MGVLKAPSVIKFEFKECKMADTRHLKEPLNRYKAYLSNRSTDFNEIWHDDAYSPSKPNL